jgi:hypothetical protein
MPENSQLDPSFLDNALSDFTDRLVSGQELDSGEIAESDQEIADLKGTVRLMSRTMNAGPPDPEMAARIRANIAAEWEKTMMPVTRQVAARTPEPGIGWWERIQGIFIGPPAQQQGRWRSPKRQQQGFSFALAGLTVIALVFVLVSGMVVPTSEVPAAVRDNSTVIAIGGVIVGIALGLIAWWTLRKPH